jgi:hypothetical protein
MRHSLHHLNIRSDSSPYQGPTCARELLIRAGKAKRAAWPWAIQGRALTRNISSAFLRLRNQY